MGFKELYLKLPPFTRFYITAIALFAYSMSQKRRKKQKHMFYHNFTLNYSLIFKKYQIWRLFTNLLIIGPFSPRFLFFCFFFYSNVRTMEVEYLKYRKYPEFIMMIIYLIIIINILNLLMIYYLNYKNSFTLAYQFLFSIIYIDSKKEPYKTVMMYFFEVQNSYVPYAFLLINLFSGKNIMENIIGIIAGNTYYFLKEIAPIQKGVDILITPKFIVDFSDKYIDSEIKNRNAFGNSGVYNRGDHYYDRYRRSHQD